MRTLVKASSMLSLVSLGEMTTRFVRTKAIALVLGITGTGVLATLTIFFEALRVLGDLGARKAVIKQVAECGKRPEDRERYGQVLRTAYGAALGISGTAGLAVMGFSVPLSQFLFHSSEFYPYLMLCGAMLPIASLYTVTASVVKGNLEYGAFTRYTLLSHGVILAVTVPAVYFFGYWGGLVVMGTFYAFPLAALLVYNVRRKYLYFSSGISRAALRENFSFGLLSVFTESITHAVRLVTAAWIIRSMGIDAMGVYQVVITFSMVYLSIPIQAIGGYTLPLIAAANDPAEISRAINDTLRFLLFTLTPVIALIMAVPEVFIVIFYSGEFLSAAPVLRVQLFHSLILIAVYTFAASLGAKGKVKSLLASSLVMPVVYFAVLYGLFDAWGLYAVAVAFVASSLVWAGVQYGFLRKELGLRLEPKNLRLIAATLVWVIATGLVASSVDSVGWRLVMLTGGIPWFWFSSKEHERRRLVEAGKNGLRWLGVGVARGKG